jgi:peroxiredoxin Q/BCP
MVEEGKPAPDFELLSDSVVLYFYPKDDTPGCAKQACGIRDVYDTFRERGAEVFGISADTQASHEKFKSKYQLPFTLLADPDRTTGEAYGVTKDDSKYFERTTFVIDPDGNVAKAMRRVDPEKHAAQVLDALPG